MKKDTITRDRTGNDANLELAPLTAPFSEKEKQKGFKTGCRSNTRSINKFIVPDVAHHLFLYEQV